MTPLGLSGSGPWIWNRIVSIWRSGTDLSAEAFANKTVECIRSHSGDDGKFFDQIRQTVRFYSRDNASDEDLTARLLQEPFGRLDVSANRLSCVFKHLCEQEYCRQVRGNLFSSTLLVVCRGLYRWRSAFRLRGHSDLAL